VNDALRMTAEDWHEWRREGIGGSDIAALVGLSKYASPTSLFYEKTGQVEGDRTDTERQRIGRRMEQVLAQEFTDRTGLYCIRQQTLWSHPDYPFARCTVDAIANDTEDPDDFHDTTNLGTVQFKTDGRFGWPDGVPPNIRAQCVWEMGVTGLSMSWLVVMFAGFRVEVFELPLDDDAASDWRFMLDAASRFWTHHVLTGDPPPVDDHPATTEALEAVHEPDPGSLLDADDDTRRLVDAVRIAQQQTKAAKAVEDTLRNELRAVLGDATDLVDGVDAKDRPVVLASWRPQVAHRFDVDAFRKAYPDLAEVFTVDTPSRVLRLHNPKGV
jgi:putative phage-type endonuclease